MKIQEAITKVMEEVRAVGKTERNQQQHFNFRGVDATVNALAPVMRKHGVSVRPSQILSRDYEHFTSKSGSQGVACRMVVEYTLTGPEGDSLTGVVAAEANDYGDKATPKCMSVAFRTFLLQAFALPTQDTDPDAEVYDRAQSQGQPVRQRQQWQPPEDYLGLARDAATLDEVRAIWQQASANGAPAAYLDEIKNLSADKPQGVAA
ncbi:ERF family protein [Sediminivirga luteola]|uniref:ERF superfamily protein n=1 Tax=Sediminivirga luteola TaxID=1774748 RepID=A0A8J2XK26_9MICO|nr:ERF family protein [Sediminivirga luteola]GGA10998.1 hypothetical protein GCM10011333_12290 [Sediminivirga luteola]